MPPKKKTSSKSKKVEEPQPAVSQDVEAMDIVNDAQPDQQQQQQSAEDYTNTADAADDADLDLAALEEYRGVVTIEPPLRLSQRYQSYQPQHADTAFSQTFVLHKETHTLGNVLRSMTIRNPDVDFCAYAQPHPTDDFIKIRVQTNGSSTATAVLREACKNVKGMAKHAQDVLAKALENKEYEWVPDPKPKQPTAEGRRAVFHPSKQQQGSNAMDLDD